MQITAHSENIEALMKQVKSGLFDSDDNWFEPIQIIRNDLLPRTKTNGKYKLPSGEVVEKDKVSFSTRFIDYGPEDVDYLVWAGVIEECREMYFYIINDSYFRMRAAFDFGPVFNEPRFSIKNFSV